MPKFEIKLNLTNYIYHLTYLYVGDYAYSLNLNQLQIFSKRIR